MIEGMWSEEHENAFIARVGAGYTLIQKNPATIDSRNFRHVFCVVNSRGKRKFFDNSKDALALARESQFQPCRIEDMPILPCGEYHTMPIKDLVILIMQKLSEG
jgi:hypothetical protein